MTWNQKILKYAAIAAPTLVNGSLYTSIFGPNPFPPMDDPAIRLKEAYALLGNTYPLWNQTPLQYPPLFNAILALLIAATSNPLSSVKFLGILLVSVMNLSIYPLVKYVTGKTTSAVVAVWLLAFHPIFSEMYGWGGYANLLAQALLLFGIYYLLRTLREGTWVNCAYATLISALIILTHHLTTIVYSAVCMAVLVLAVYECVSLGSISQKSVKVVIPIITALVAFILWRFLAGEFQFITYNYASLATRPFDAEAFWWIFKDQFAAALLLITAMTGTFILYLSGKKRELLVLMVLAVFPFLFTQAHFLGIALDFRRFPSFAVPALISLSSAILMPLKPGDLTYNAEKHVSTFKVEGMLLASLMLLTLSSNLIVGLAMPFKVNEYYHYLQDYAYGVEEKLEALDWIRHNTPCDAVFVADSSLGRWVEGYGQRRTLLELEPYQIFIKGELERYIASNTILHSNILLLNQYIRVWDDAPYHSSHTPWIGVSSGPDYRNVLYLVDGTVETKFTFAGSLWIESPYRAKIEGVKWLSMDDEYAAFSLTYISKSLNITKVVTLRNESAELQITYVIKPVIEAGLIEAELPLWVPYECTLSNPRFYGGKLHFTVDGIQVALEVNGNTTVGRDNRWGQQRILCTFSPSNNTIEAHLNLTFLNSRKNWWNTRLVAAFSDELIRKYNVSHIILSKNKDDYVRFVEDPRMKLAYENSKLIIFSVEK